MYGKYAYIKYGMYRYHDGITRNMRTYSMYRYHDGVIPRSGDSTHTDIHIHIHVYDIRKDEHIMHERMHERIYYGIQIQADEHKYQILYTI